VPATIRVLKVAFETAEDFAQEYASNLSNGGIFVAGAGPVELRETVTVEIALAFCGEHVQLEGEVVHIVTPDMAAAGATPGIAVQFNGDQKSIREKFQPLVVASGASAEPAPDVRRAAPRVAARLHAWVATGGESYEGRTRNISQSGVLLAVPGRQLPVGESVRVTLEHPTSGATMEIQGKVAREIETEGGETALGIEFDSADLERDEVARFIEALQTCEHTRQLGGIAGSLEELGPQNVLQMFSTSAPVGTLILRRRDDEGMVCFQNGLLHLAQLGPATGMKALVRMLGWRDGSFEFHARLEAQASEPPLPLEAALFEAVVKLDEFAQLDASRFPPNARVLMNEAAAAADEHGKLESAVLDLARAGFTVQRIVDVIPEPDPDILRAFGGLADAGAIRFENKP